VIEAAVVEPDEVLATARRDPHVEELLEGRPLGDAPFLEQGTVALQEVVHEPRRGRDEAARLVTGEVTRRTEEAKHGALGVLVRSLARRGPCARHRSVMARAVRVVAAAPEGRLHLASTPTMQRAAGRGSRRRRTRRRLPGRRGTQRRVHVAPTCSTRVTWRRRVRHRTLSFPYRRERPLTSPASPCGWPSPASPARVASSRRTLRPCGTRDTRARTRCARDKARRPIRQPQRTIGGVVYLDRSRQRRRGHRRAGVPASPSGPGLGCRHRRRRRLPPDECPAHRNRLCQRPRRLPQRGRSGQRWSMARRRSTSRYSVR
jgi:hypothetical protein